MFALQLGVHKQPLDGSPGAGHHLVRMSGQQFEQIDESATKGLRDEDPGSRSSGLRSLIENQIVVQLKLVLLMDKRVKLDVDRVWFWKTIPDPASELLVGFVSLASFQDLANQWVKRDVRFRDFLVDDAVVLVVTKDGVDFSDRLGSGVDNDAVDDAG